MDVVYNAARERRKIEKLGRFARLFAVCGSARSSASLSHLQQLPFLFFAVRWVSLNASPTMNRLRKARKLGESQPYIPLHPFFAGVKDDEPFWMKLPDILQAQVLVMLDNGRPTKKNPKPREAEKLLWAGTPHLRKRTIFVLFVMWMVLLVVPSMLLHELVDEIGGWCALAWAVASVFIFVPRISRGSREVFACSSRRLFISKRSMWCSINSQKADYSDIASAKLVMHKDGSGTFTFTKTKIAYHPTERVIFDRVRDVRGACRVLAQVLPEEVAQEAGFSEG